MALYVVATAAGARQSAGSPSASGLPQALGGVLVLPASAGDVAAAATGCAAGKELVVPAARACAYRLRGGFLAKRLSLRLTAGTAIGAVLVQPKPKVTDTETLDVAHASKDMVYSQDGSTLTLTCGADQRAGCSVRVG